MKIDQILKGHVQNVWERVFCRKKYGPTLGHTGPVKHNEIIQDHKDANFDTLKPFSVSYSTIWDDLYSRELRPAVNERGPVS